MKASLKFSTLVLTSIFLLFSFYFLTGKFIFGQSTSVKADAPSQNTLTYRTSVSANGIFSGGGLSVTLPSNIQAGDLLIAVVGTNGPSSSWSTPNGWTKGDNSNTTDTQGLNWWWKVADGTEAGTVITLKSSKYADGGVVVNVYEGQAVNPIAGVSPFTTSDNFGNGFVTSAAISGVTFNSPATGASLIFASWQPNPTTLTWPSGFGFESTAGDGYSTVAVGESFSSQTTDSFPGYTLSFSPAEAVVQTLQVIVRVR